MEAKDYICTVLLISYNHEKYLKRAIESVLNQKTSYKYKLCIFDDFSTDGSADIISEYAGKYPDKVYAFISPENLGSQGNMWRAYKSVNTRYFCVLEGDDFWCSPDKLELQINALEENPDCSFCAHNSLYMNENDVYRADEDGKVFVYNRNVRDTGKYTGEDFIYLYGAGWVHHINSRLIRTSIIDFDGLTDKEDLLYDNAQFFYLIERGKLYFIQKIMTVYNMNCSGSFTSLSVQKKIRSHCSRMLHINETTNRKYEILIMRHLASFTSYWLGLDDIQAGRLKKQSDIRMLISRKYKKIRYDLIRHARLRKEALAEIKQLSIKMEKLK